MSDAPTYCEECYEDPCECAPPEPPSQWELYSTELDGELRAWDERANHPGFAIMRWLSRWYEGADRVHEASVRTSPLLAWIPPAKPELLFFVHGDCQLTGPAIVLG